MSTRDLRRAARQPGFLKKVWSFLLKPWEVDRWGGRYVWSIRSGVASLSAILEEREKKMPPKKGGKAAGKGKGKGGGKGGGKKGGPTIIDGVS